MPFLLNLLRNPYVLGVLAVILVGGIQQARVWKAERGLLSCESNFTQQQARWADASRAGHKAAQGALQAAIVREREELARKQAEDALRLDRLREAARAAQREAEEWRARYREAVATDPGCQAWASEPVRCPVD